MILLLPIVYALIFLCLRRRSAGTLREVAVKSSVCFAGAVVVLTEILSPVSALTRPTVAAAWLAAIACLILLLSRPHSATVRRERFSLLRMPHGQRILLVGASVIVLGTCLTAIVAAPNNWDSMTYHLSRVAHWQERASVSFFATSHIAELQPPPFAEYVILQFHILSGSDRFDALLQWLCTIGSAIAASLLAGELGATRRGQIAAALFVTTIPMGILQASSTQNDMVAGMWLITSAYLALRFLASPCRRSALFLGWSCGLAILTKGTNYAYLAPIAAGTALALLRRSGRSGWKFGLLIVGIVVGINLPHAWRNTMLFGDPLGLGQSGVKITNDTISPGVAVCNLLRNSLLHVTIPPGPARTSAEAAMAGAVSKFGIDINDPASTWPGTAFHLTWLSNHEDLAGNPVHAALIALTVLLVYAFRRYRAHPQTPALALSVLVAYVLFCALFRWQPWNSRLHLPLFVLSAPLVAVTLEARGARWTAATGGLLLAAAIPWVLFNGMRPLVTHTTVGLNRSVFLTQRADQYFNARPEVRQGYRKAMDTIRHLESGAVGMLLGDGDYEYPLHLSRPCHSRVRYEHIGVTNESRRYARSDFVPDAVVSTVVGLDGTLRSGGVEYRLLWRLDPVSFWVRATGADTP